MDIDDPRNPNNVNRPHSDWPSSLATREGDTGYLWPILAVIVTLIAGLFFFATPRTDQPSTQVSEKVERPATPNTMPKTTTPQ